MIVVIVKSGGSHQVLNFGFWRYMVVAMRMVTTLILAAGVAAAEPVPGFENEPEPGFFSGLYEVVGRGSDSGFHGEPMRLELSGHGLDVRGCVLGDGRLDYARTGEAFVLEGQIEGAPIWCRFLIDAGNYPVLTCANPEGLRLTLWPQGDFDAPLICP